VTSNGFNLSSDYSCGLSLLSDKQGVTQQLGPLAYKGGATLNALPIGSPTLDSGQCGTVTDDQRGIHHLQRPVCDIGAVKSLGFPLGLDFCKPFSNRFRPPLQLFSDRLLPLLSIFLGRLIYILPFLESQVTVRGPWRGIAGPVSCRIRPEPV
jgi:hypothetical protein